MFCKFCGKEIPEGGVCTCEGAVAQRTAENTQDVKRRMEQQAPQYAAPQQQAPQYGAPQYAAPQQQAPQYSAPQYAAPQQQAPQYGAPQYGAPQQQAPQYGAPQQQAPQYGAPQYGVPQQAAPRNSEFSNKLVKALTQIPATFLAIFKKTGDVKMDVFSGVIFAVIGFLIHMLSWICLAGSCNITAGGSIKGIYGTFILCSFLTYLVLLVWRFVIPLIGQLFRKEKIDVTACLSSAVSMSILPALVFLLSGLLCLISLKLGLFFTLIAIVIALAETHRLTGRQIGGGHSSVKVLIISVVLTLIIASVFGIDKAVLSKFVLRLARGFM